MTDQERLRGLGRSIVEGTDGPETTYLRLADLGIEDLVPVVAGMVASVREVLP